MMKNTTPETPELHIHTALLALMQTGNLSLVEMDQLIYPDESGSAGTRFGQVAQCRVYLQVLDTTRTALASGSYMHALTRGQSPFVGVRAIPGSARQQVLDAMVETLSTAKSQS